MAVIEFNVAKFRETFPEFSDPILYTDLFLEGKWISATCYVSDADAGQLSGACREYAIQLMTAHLCKIFKLIQEGLQPSYAVSSSIDKISVGLQPPPINTGDFFRFWLMATAYGQELAALLKMRSVGGFMVGGLNEINSVRRAGGV